MQNPSRTACIMISVFVLCCRATVVAQWEVPNDPAYRRFNW